MQNRFSALQTDRPRSHEEHYATRDRVDPGHVPPGLTTAQARARLAEVGRNVLPQSAPRSVVAVFLRQFLSPLIYILLAAAAVSLALGDLKDALFIGAVLLINGVIGTAQEHTADKATVALGKMEQPRATVIRDGVQQEIDASTLVRGDLVVLEAGSRMPADLELTYAIDLQCDESLLTGESLPVRKLSACDTSNAPGSDRQCLTFAGTVVLRGRGHGIVGATGAATQIGRIARELGRESISQPPLILRLQRFSRLIAGAVGVAVALLVLVGMLHGMALRELFMMSVGLAVSAIPEVLPVAISVALAISMRRMAKAHVIVRKMPAVESLGSCTKIATDKTGTLTMNGLVVTDIRLPDGTAVSCDVGHDLGQCTIRAAGTNEVIRDIELRLRRYFVTSEWEERKASLRQHVAIFEAIRAQDVAEAERLTRPHLARTESMAAQGLPGIAAFD
ncbi:HAD-IC family P-type ATPase (plasmid) [Cupriavidus necator]|uniref:FCD domain-containing protein n=1 Tax=Cupriavidus necator TaxID=106590 RepID=A0A367PKG7_CUPNE|nr:HAD-IC family P-type ATPase [Cupriavidus necator]QQX89882.1 HAD-IC family P-type ATPase [Cupriavidus necator]RCJ08308.1 FCD domain-containing protein [Cupriavidus necator]